MEIRSLSDELRAKAEKELNEDSSRMVESLNHIKGWLSKQNHLIAREEDQYLISFLRGCKYRLQLTKQKLDFFYSVRTLMPHFYLNRDPFNGEMQELLRAGAAFVLPQIKGSTDPTTIICMYSVCCYETMPFLNLLKALFMLIDIQLNEDDNMLISGLRIVVDYKGYDLKYLLQLTPTVIRDLLVCLQNAYPIRVKGFYSINVPAMYKTMYAIAKPFLKEKLKKRFHMYQEKSINDFYSAIGQTILPKEYGGNNGTVKQLTADLKNKVERYRNWFLEDSKFGLREEFRSFSSERDSLSILGAEGSFRKLDID